MFDLVLFGATGFTGRLVAEYLRDHAEPGLAWAIAGRDRGKLEALRAELARARGGRDVPVLVGDVSDPPSLAAIVAQARVVCTTVGPYTRYGPPLVAACAERGVDYCDLTGESNFIRQMIDQHHAEAERTGARIVHACGFDSVPSDLGVHVLQSFARARFGAPCGSVAFYLERARGGVSGGTVASMMGIVDLAKRDRATRKVLLDPYALNPEGERAGPDRDPRGVAFDPRVGGWTVPFFMGPINTRVVRRTNALSEYSYGRDFRYTELQRLPGGPLGFIAGAALMAGLGATMAAAAVPLARRVLDQLLPAAGEGPSASSRANGYFVVGLRGEGHDRDGRPFAVRGEVSGRGDPGYAATALMLGESASCLAKDPKATGGGVLTPAYALGDALVARLRAAGMTFSAEEVPA